MSKHVIVFTDDNGKRRKIVYLLKETALVMYRELLRNCYFDTRYFKLKDSHQTKR